MKRLFSNGTGRDLVINPFKDLAGKSSQLHLAAPYFTQFDVPLQAALSGSVVQLLIGLNAATDPSAVRKVLGVPNLSVRYLTHRFHAKIFIFDNAALVGSSNLTDGGLVSNREAVIRLDEDHDGDTIEEIRGLFVDLWHSGLVLNSTVAEKFEAAWKATRSRGPDDQEIIEGAIGRAEPLNINVKSGLRTREQSFLEGLRRKIFEGYRPAFLEVTKLLAAENVHRPELVGVGLENETNRFLNWVRLSYVSGDAAWQTAPILSLSDRELKLKALASEWKSTQTPKIPPEYLGWLEAVGRVFGTSEILSGASREEITDGLMSLHAFTSQDRFVAGGISNVPGAFWAENRGDVERVRATLMYFLHGPGDFISRLHDVLYEPTMKLRMFGQFSALELYGTVKPQECPPINGRMVRLSVSSGTIFASDVAG